MNYTGFYSEKYSTYFKQNVSILKYTSKDKTPFCDCDLCGKPIKRTLFTVQDANDLVLANLGSDCVKKI